jgi:Fic family protein
MHQLLEGTTLAMGRLDALSSLLPDPALFIYAYVRKEAVLSSQIEGTQSSLSDLMLFESSDAPGVPLDDIKEVSNYVAALEHGLERMRNGFPLSNRLIREIHGILLNSGRGSERSPGEFRRTQNWIGGTRPGNAMYVPPPPAELAVCMGDFERFLHSVDDGLPMLIRVALAHVQFETIHPFLDGNGRVGRLLITLLLCHAGVLKEPLLYLSLYLKRHRSTYYDLLDRVRHTGDWEAWLEFILDGMKETAEGAVSTARNLTQMFDDDRRRIEGSGRRTGSALRIHHEMMARPIVSIAGAAERAALAFRTASASMDVLVDLGILREVTGQRRNRLFAYHQYLGILNEGIDESVTEPRVT